MGYQSRLRVGEHPIPRYHVVFMNLRLMMAHQQQATSETRILLADDHYLVRAGIRSLLEALPGVTVVAEAGNGREALEAMKREKLDLVLLDISMPGLNGLETLPRIKTDFPGVPVIILSMHQS